MTYTVSSGTLNPTQQQQRYSTLGINGRCEHVSPPLSAWATVSGIVSSFRCHASDLRCCRWILIFGGRWAGGESGHCRRLGGGVAIVLGSVARNNSINSVALSTCFVRWYWPLSSATHRCCLAAVWSTSLLKLNGAYTWNEKKLILKLFQCFMSHITAY